MRQGTTNFGSLIRNRFTRDQGVQSTGGNNTYTINLDTSWAGLLTEAYCGEGTADKNYCLDNGAEVLVRRNG